jgi:hypothetical protein
MKEIFTNYLKEGYFRFGMPLHSLKGFSSSLIFLLFHLFITACFLKDRVKKAFRKRYN